MDEDRRRLIEAHWKHYGARWPSDGRPTFRVPVQPQTSPNIRWHVRSNAVSVAHDVLTFVREDGWIDGRRAVRVVCEGHCVLEFLV